MRYAHTEPKRKGAAKHDQRLAEREAEVPARERKVRLVHLAHAGAWLATAAARPQAARDMRGICTHFVDIHVAELVKANDADVHQQCRDDGLEHTKRSGSSQVGRAAQRHERDGDDAQLRG